MHNVNIIELFTSADGPTNIIDTCSSSKAYEMIAELCMTQDQLYENGYPRCGSRSGVATIFNNRMKATPINENERYCRRCGKVFNFTEYDEECTDRCNYHPKSPGFRRGNYSINTLKCTINMTFRFILPVLILFPFAAIALI